MMANNSIYAKNRTKTNYKNYKEVCKALNEPEHKRGSREKAEQIARWETE